MKSSSNLVIDGVVLAALGGTPVGGVTVRVRAGKSKRSAGRSTTDAQGQFTMSLAVGAGVTLSSAERLHFTVSGTVHGRPFHSFEPLQLSRLGERPLQLEIPEAAMVRPFGKPEVEILVDEVPARRISVGQSIAVRGRQLRPASSYQLHFSVGRGSKARCCTG